MRKKLFLDSILIISVFVISFYGNKILNSHLPVLFTSTFFRLSFFYIWWVIPTMLVLGILYGFNDIFKILGLKKGIITAFLFSIITASPMLLSSAIIGKIADNLNFGDLMHKTIVAGFFEEYLFRGFLFGILFTKLRWGFIPASILGGLVFGTGHLYQGASIMETLGIFSLTAVGAIWFAWLYIEWDKNLWVPIFLHSFMNLSWVLFDVSENALGGVFSNIFRAITIGFTIMVTIRYHKKRGLIINRKNLLINTGVDNDL